MEKKVLLTILDGWGISENKDYSAVDQADTPYIDRLYKKYLSATLRTDGEHVGLPEGQMGNSEVGHMNLGAGRIVYQDLAKINRAVVDGSLGKNKELVEAFAFAKANNSSLHLIGLCSDGGVHSHIDHLLGLLNLAKAHDLKKIFIHAFTDGRDVDPKSGVNHISAIQDHIADSPAVLSSIIGRYYAMDRDNRWERTANAYDLLVRGKGERTENPTEKLLQFYKDDKTDEFIPPLLVSEDPQSRINDGDVVIFFNFRTDRGRQLTAALSQKAIEQENLEPLNIRMVTMTKYDQTFEDVHILFEKNNLKNTLGEVLSAHGKSQLRIAETEKYPHVTFFFNGGREEPFEGEQRIMCNSPKVATYDLQPEMSIDCISDKLLPVLSNEQPDFICLNFANPDMVGHTGSMEAAVAACEAVDKHLSMVVDEAEKNGYSVVIIADHGNCEVMMNEDGSINTAHTTNPVPLILIDKDISEVKSGILGDIAPTVLKLLGVVQPEEMTQKPLI